MSGARTIQFPTPVRKPQQLNARFVAGIVDDRFREEHKQVCVMDAKTGELEVLDETGVEDIVVLSEDRFVTVSLNFCPNENPHHDYWRCDALVWDIVGNSQIQVNREIPLFYDGLPMVLNHIRDVRNLVAFSDGRHVAGVITYFGPHHEGVTNVEVGVFILDIETGQVQCLTQLPDKTIVSSLTVLTNNRLAVTTLLNGIYLYEVNFDRNVWAELFHHLKPNTPQLPTNDLAGLLESHDGRFWATYDTQDNFVIWQVRLNGTWLVARYHRDDVMVDPVMAPDLLPQRLLDGNFVFHTRNGEVRMIHPSAQDSLCCARFPRRNPLVGFFSQSPDSVAVIDSEQKVIPVTSSLSKAVHDAVPSFPKELSEMVADYTYQPVLFTKPVELRMQSRLPMSLRQKINKKMHELQRDILALEKALAIKRVEEQKGLGQGLAEQVRIEMRQDLDLKNDKLNALALFLHREMIGNQSIRQCVDSVLRQIPNARAARISSVVGDLFREVMQFAQGIEAKNTMQRANTAPSVELMRFS